MSRFPYDSIKSIRSVFQQNECGAFEPRIIEKLLSQCKVMKRVTRFDAELVEKVCSNKIDLNNSVIGPENVSDLLVMPVFDPQEKGITNSVFFGTCISGLRIAGRTLNRVVFAGSSSDREKNRSSIQGLGLDLSGTTLDQVVFCYANLSGLYAKNPKVVDVVFRETVLLNACFDGYADEIVNMEKSRELCFCGDNDQIEINGAVFMQNNCPSHSLLLQLRNIAFVNCLFTGYLQPFLLKNVSFNRCVFRGSGGPDNIPCTLSMNTGELIHSDNDEGNQGSFRQSWLLKEPVFATDKTLRLDSVKGAFRIEDVGEPVTLILNNSILYDFTITWSVKCTDRKITVIFEDSKSLITNPKLVGYDKVSDQTRPRLVLQQSSNNPVIRVDENASISGCSLECQSESGTLTNIFEISDTAMLDMSDVIFRGPEGIEFLLLAEVNFDRTVLKNTRFEKCHLKGCIFKDADDTPDFSEFRCTFVSCKFSGNYDNSNFSWFDFSKCQVSKGDGISSIEDHSFREISGTENETLIDVNLQNSILPDGLLRRMTLRNCKMVNLGVMMMEQSGESGIHFHRTSVLNNEEMKIKLPSSLEMQICTFKNLTLEIGNDNGDTSLKVKNSSWTNVRVKGGGSTRLIQSFEGCTLDNVVLSKLVLSGLPCNQNNSFESMFKQCIINKLELDDCVLESEVITENCSTQELILNLNNTHSKTDDRVIMKKPSFYKKNGEDNAIICFKMSASPPENHDRSLKLQLINVKLVDSLHIELADDCKFDQQTEIWGNEGREISVLQNTSKKTYPQKIYETDKWPGIDPDDSKKREFRKIFSKWGTDCETFYKMRHSYANAVRLFQEGERGEFIGLKGAMLEDSKLLSNELIPGLMDESHILSTSTWKAMKLCFEKIHKELASNGVEPDVEEIANLLRESEEMYLLRLKPHSDIEDTYGLKHRSLDEWLEKELAIMKGSIEINQESFDTLTSSGMKRKVYLDYGAIKELHEQQHFVNAYFDIIPDDDRINKDKDCRIFLLALKWEKLTQDYSSNINYHEISSNIIEKSCFAGRIINIENGSSTIVWEDPKKIKSYPNLPVEDEPSSWLELLIEI